MSNDFYLTDALSKERVFFVGIGGISMSSLAHLALAAGKIVAGSDRSASAATAALEAAGAKIVIRHYPESVIGYDLVVYTAAVSHETSPELRAAAELGIPTLSRGEYLGALMCRYQRRIGVSGTHGKTTTTTLLSHITLSLDTDPTVLNGALSKTLDGKAYRIGGDEWFLYEACEYKASFHDFHPTVAIVTGVELDHTDFYPDLDAMIAAFTKSLDGAEIVVINRDDAGAVRAAEGFGGKTVGFSIQKEADYYAKDIRFEGKTTYFTLVHNGREYPVVMPLLGAFNIQNALAALSAAGESGLDLLAATKSLSDFEAPDRRFSVLYRGDVTVADDYAHHPSEIFATLSSARSLVKGEGRLITVFQSHTYTRTHDLFDDFASSLSLSDLVFMPDIYAARETNTLGVSSASLCRAIGEKARYIESFDEIARELFKLVRPGDVIITMGAGDVYKIGNMLTALLEKRPDTGSII